MTSIPLLRIERELDEGFYGLEQHKSARDKESVGENKINKKMTFFWRSYWL